MARRSLILLVLLACASAAGAAEPPRGNITIDRIAAIKYPTNPTWSPNGRMVAFLWDQGGKQDLYVVTPGLKPVALTDFAVDPSMRLSDIGQFAWLSDDQILFARNRQLWSVSLAERKPAPFPGPS